MKLSRAGSVFRKIPQCWYAAAVVAGAAYLAFVPVVKELDKTREQIVRGGKEVEGCRYHVNNMLNAFENAYRQKNATMFQIR